MMEQIIHRFSNCEVWTIFSSLTIFHLTSRGVKLLLDCAVCCISAVLCVWCALCCGLKYLYICSNLLTSNPAAALCLLTKLAEIVSIQSSQRAELCDWLVINESQGRGQGRDISLFVRMELKCWIKTINKKLPDDWRWRWRWWWWW